MYKKRKKTTKSSENKIPTNKKLALYLVSKIKEGNKLFWRTPYIDTKGRNYITGRYYNGYNYLITTFLGSGDYITINQLKEYNEKNNTKFYVKKGASGFPLSVYNHNTKKISNEYREKLISEGKEKYIQEKNGEFFINNFYSGLVYVFDVEDIIDIETKNQLPRKENSARRNSELNQNEFLDNLIYTYAEKSGVKLNENHQRIGRVFASYSPTLDALNIPSRTKFISDNEYYYAVFHEIIHSTGHMSRLKRLGENSVGISESESQEYSNEEIIAEFGSSLLMQELGFSSEVESRNASSYLNAFCDWLINNPDDLLSCVRKSEEAVKYVLDLVGLEYKAVSTKEVPDKDELSNLNEEEFKQVVNKDLVENVSKKEPTISPKSSKFIKIFDAELERTLKVNKERFLKRCERIKGNEILNTTFKKLGIQTLRGGDFASQTSMFCIVQRTKDISANKILVFNTSFAYILHRNKVKLVYNLDGRNSSLKDAMELCNKLGFPQMTVILQLLNLKSKKLNEDNSLYVYLKLFEATLSNEDKKLLKTNKEQFIKKITA